MTNNNINKLIQDIASILNNKEKSLEFSYKDIHGEISHKRLLKPETLTVNDVIGSTPEGFRHFKLNGIFDFKVIEDNNFVIYKNGDFFIDTKSDYIFQIFINNEKMVNKYYYFTINTNAFDEVTVNPPRPVNKLFAIANIKHIPIDEILKRAIQ